MPITDEQRERILTLTSGGVTLTAAARMVDVTRHTAKEVLYDAGLLAEKPVEAPSKRSEAQRRLNVRKRKQEPFVAPQHPATSFRPHGGDMPAPVRWWDACKRCGRFTCGHERS